MLPEYLMFRLTGVKAREYTNATTMGSVNARTGEFDRDITDKLGLPKHLFPELFRPGTVLGYLRQEIAEAVGGNWQGCAVRHSRYRLGSCRVFLTEGNQPDISSGTWSLLEVETSSPITDDKSEKANYSNEGGVGYNRYQKNIMGMWLVKNGLRQGYLPRYGL